MQPAEAVKFFLVIAILWGQPFADAQPTTVASWAETARLVGDAYCRNDLSAAYLRQTLADARRDIESVRLELARAHRDSQVQEARATIAVIERIDRAVLASDRERACAAVRELAVADAAVG